MVTIDAILNILQILSAAVLAVLTWRMLTRRHGASVLGPAFFAFTLITLIMSDFYWLTYGILRPDTRMPFSASEIGECGVFLLLAACLSSTLQGDTEKLSKRGKTAAVLLPALFAAINTALWIGWNGGWVTDILTGLSYAVLLIVCLRSLLGTGALKTPEKIALFLCAFLLTALQGATFFVGEELRQTLDLICYILMFSGLGLMFLRIAVAFFRRETPGRLLSMSGTLMSATVCVLYMSADNMYRAASLCLTASLFMIFFALRRVCREREAAV